MVNESNVMRLYLFGPDMSAMQYPIVWLSYRIILPHCNTPKDLDPG